MCYNRKNLSDWRNMNLKLTELRMQNGYETMGQFARRLHMSESTYANYESGRRKVSLQLACVLADALHCSLDELAGRATKDESSDLMRLYASMSDEGKDALLAAAIGIARAFPESAHQKRRLP